MVVDLADTAGAWIPTLALVGLEGGGRRVSWRRVNILGSFAFCDPAVDLDCGRPLHLIGDVSVNVQGSGEEEGSRAEEIRQNGENKRLHSF